MRGNLFGLLLVSLSLVSCSSAFRSKGPVRLDLPGWSRFRGDDQNTACMSSQAVLPNKLLWKHDFHKPMKSSPIIVGRIMVIGAPDKRVHFLDAVSGKHLGVHKTPSAVSTSASSSGSRIYFGLQRGRETLVGFDLETGKAVWKRSLGDVSSSPQLCRGKILVGSSSGILWALDQGSGEELWRFETSAPILSTPACHESAAAGAGGEVIYFGSTDGSLRALASDGGQMIWAFDAKEGIYSSPAVKNGRVFFGSANGEVYGVNLNDGSLEWSFKTGADVYSSPAVADSLVYIGSNDYFMYALDQTSGELVWKFKTGGLVRSSPVAVGDKLFFGSYDGCFYVLDRFTGKLLWKYQTKGMISSSPAYYEGKVYLASEDGYLYCFGR
jgi:outer membrane protein assembly factor BamB